MEIQEIQVLETEIVVTEDVVAEVALIELMVVQFEFALLLAVVLRWGSSKHLPLPAT